MIDADDTQEQRKAYARMPGANSPVPIPEPWTNWLPDGFDPPADDELITRDVVLARLNEEGKERGWDVSPRVLQRWEHLGLSPQPIRRRVDGKSKAVYPPWVVGVLAVVANQVRHYVEHAEVAQSARKQAWFEVNQYRRREWFVEPSVTETVTQLALDFGQGNDAGPVTAVEVTFWHKWMKIGHHRFDLPYGPDSPGKD